MGRRCPDSGGEFHEGVPLVAVGTAPQPLGTFFAALFTDEHHFSGGLVRFAHSLTLQDFQGEGKGKKFTLFVFVLFFSVMFFECK